MYLVAKNLYDPCDEPIQCTESFGPGAECSGAKGCTCVPTNHFVPSLLKCIENKGKELLSTIRDRRSCLHCFRRFFQVEY